MRYQKICEGVFLSRPNRFIAHVRIDGVEHVCHVKNTGRCKELLVPGATVYLEESDKKERKTKYDLVAVRKGELLINMDSQAPNQVVKEWIQEGGLVPEYSLLRPEMKHGNSRVDFYLEKGERKIFVEVKGVTLEREGIASFPDAPTERGIKHIHHLIDAVQEGYEGYLIFVIQFQPVSYFVPNNETHMAFGEALAQAKKAGVHILAFDCLVTEETLQIADSVEVRID